MRICDRAVVNSAYARAASGRKTAARWQFWNTVPCGARLLAAGEFSDDDLGVACYHAKTGAVELYLNHLADGPGEYVVTDCTAGADSFASGLFTRFDLTVLVVEPTRKSAGVYRQWRDYAAGFGVALAVAGNKVQTEDDVVFLREQCGDDLTACFGVEPAVRALEQGRPLALTDLGPATRAGLGALQDRLDEQVKDWAGYARQAAEFHLKNAARATQDARAELTAQVDPDFTLEPAAAVAAS